MRKLSVSIVIPNWNGEHLLRKHMPSVIRAAAGCEIIVTDDNSQDGSVRLISEKFSNVRLVANSIRQGFAGNVNSGVAAAHGDIVILLNTDVEPEKNFLKPILVHFDDPKVFAVGCLEKSYDPGGIVLRGRGEARWVRGYFVHSRADVDKTDTAWVSGGSGAFRRSIWNELGGMDTLYNPFYWEDIDLSYQARKAGYRVVFEKRSVIGHYHEEGKIKSDFSPEKVKRIAYRNQFIFIWKNLSDPIWWVMHMLWTPLYLARAVVRGDFRMVEGWFLAFTRWPRILQSRTKAAAHWKLSDRALRTL